MFVISASSESTISSSTRRGRLHYLRERRPREPESETCRPKQKNILRVRGLTINDTVTLFRALGDGQNNVQVSRRIWSRTRSWRAPGSAIRWTAWMGGVFGESRGPTVLDTITISMFPQLLYKLRFFLMDVQPLRRQEDSLVGTMRCAASVGESR